MTRSNPVVSRKTFLAVARGFLLEEREEAYFRIDWAKTMTDPHFLRQADRMMWSLCQTVSIWSWSGGTSRKT